MAVGDGIGLDGLQGVVGLAEMSVLAVVILTVHFENCGIACAAARADLRVAYAAREGSGRSGWS